jgi:hypothetical protein
MIGKDWRATGPSVESAAAVDDYSRAYPWLISHDLSHGVPLMECEYQVIYHIEYVISNIVGLGNDFQTVFSPSMQGPWNLSYCW